MTFLSPLDIVSARRRAKKMTLEIKGFWDEEEAPVKDAQVDSQRSGKG